MPQLANTTPQSGLSVNLRWPYQAKVIKTFDMQSRTIGASGDDSNGDTMGEARCGEDRREPPFSHVRPGIAPRHRGAALDVRAATAPRGYGTSGPVIGVAAQDGRRAIELLGEHDAREAVRQGDGAQRELQVGGSTRRFAQAVGSADENAGGFRAAVASLGQESCESLAAQRLAAHIEGDDEIRLAHRL